VTSNLADRRDARRALIDDADRWPRKVIGPLGRVGKCLVMAARWLREAAGRHRAQFSDGAAVWVVYGPGRAAGYVPLGTSAIASMGGNSADAPLTVTP
jgi:hypothetical protein